MNCLYTGWSSPADSAIARSRASWARAQYDLGAVTSAWTGLTSGRLSIDQLLASSHCGFPWATATLRRLVDEPDGQTTRQIRCDAIEQLWAAFLKVQARYTRSYKALEAAREADEVARCTVWLPLDLVPAPEPELPLVLVPEVQS